MKKLVAMCAISMLAFAGCYVCQDSVTCDKNGKAIQACCVSTQCEYRVDGKTFKCDGSKCDDAAKEAVNYCSN